MKHNKILPPAHLRDYVQYYWTLESDETENGIKTFRTIADGSPGLIFQHSENGGFSQFDKKLPSIFLYGQTTTCTEIRSPAAFKAIGVYFTPHVLKTLFGFRANELTDTCIDIEATAESRDFRLNEQLLNAPNTLEQVDIISAYLTAQVCKNEMQMDAPISYALMQIIQTKGLISLKDLQHELGMSERNFERRFQHNIGLSPKLYCRISRFQASLSQLRNKKYDKLSDIAFEQEYSDQSHFIRAFKEFAGLLPNQYQKTWHERVENFPELVS